MTILSKENNPYQHTQNEYWKYFVIENDYKVLLYRLEKQKIIEGLINIYRIYLNYTEITVSHSILNKPLISAYLFPLMFSFSYRKTITPALNPWRHPTEEGFTCIPQR
jgi:hypothetical protein